MNKIYIYRLGGLGNQLFQIACGYSLAKEYNKKLIINPRTNDGLTINTQRSNFDNLFYNLEKEELPENPKYFHENGFNYKRFPNLLNFDYLTLYGYFQSEKYFINYKDEIKNLFLTPLQNSQPINFNKNNECFKNNTISLHIRRTDYLNHPNIHPTCSINYYIKALQKLNYESKKVFIFSDDVKYCQENEFFKTIKNKEIVKRKSINNSSFNTLIDFYNMSGCQNHIISNSTFSWWSSYLSQNPYKQIIAPKIWFGKDFKESWSDIYTDNMIIL